MATTTSGAFPRRHLEVSHAIAGLDQDSDSDAYDSENCNYKLHGSETSGKGGAWLARLICPSTGSAGGFCNQEAR
jgi:hypothetical protein